MYAPAPRRTPPAMLHWMAALVAGSLAYALADILCDVVIAEVTDGAVETVTEDDDVSTTGRACVSTPVHSRIASPVFATPGFATPGFATPGYRALGQETPYPTETLQPGLAEPPVVDEDARSMVSSTAEVEGLTGPQDAAISGLVTTVGLVLAVGYQLLRTPSIAALGSHLKWRPGTHLEFWFALLGGICSFLHNFFLLKAFEHAPSTVLLPLIQVASVSVLFGSSALALLRGDKFITPTHAVAGSLLAQPAPQDNEWPPRARRFFGGLLPATGGQLSTLLQPAFWRQRFVGLAVASELTLGLHDLLLSGCAYERPHAQQHGRPAEGEEGTESFEFVVWSRCAFVITFFSAYLLVRPLRDELLDLCAGRVRARF
eukprot:6459685-Prymnesium_polylepis.1